MKGLASHTPVQIIPEQVPEEVIEGGVPELTPRMKQVLQAMVDGGDSSARAVAQQLGISPRAVEHVLHGDASSYMKSGGVLERLGVSGKTEAVVKAIRLGIVELPEEEETIEKGDYGWDERGRRRRELNWGRKRFLIEKRSGQGVVVCEDNSGSEREVLFEASLEELRVLALRTKGLDNKQIDLRRGKGRNNTSSTLWNLKKKNMANLGELVRGKRGTERLARVAHELGLLNPISFSEIERIIKEEL